MESDCLLLCPPAKEENMKNGREKQRGMEGEKRKGWRGKERGEGRGERDRGRDGEEERTGGRNEEHRYIPPLCFLKQGPAVSPELTNQS